MSAVGFAARLGDAPQRGTLQRLQDLPPAPIATDPGSTSRTDMLDDDSHVIARSLQDASEFAVIFDRHFGTIHRYLARRVGGDVADDLAAEVFTVAFARRSSYDTDRPLALPWLYGIASNLLRADLRHQQRRDHAHERLASQSRADAVAEPLDERVVTSLDAQRHAQGLQGRLADLSVDDATTLALYAWEDLSYEEIAEALEIPVGTVRSRLHRVRRKLREPESADGASTRRNGPHQSREQER